MPPARHRPRAILAAHALQRNLAMLLQFNHRGLLTQHCQIPQIAPKKLLCGSLMPSVGNMQIICKDREPLLIPVPKNNQHLWVGGPKS